MKPRYTVVQALAGRPSGLYRWDATLDAVAVEQQARSERWTSLILDGSGVRDQASFLSACAAACGFPAAAGRDWTALLRALCDLAWTSSGGGRVLLAGNLNAFALAHPADWARAADRLRAATQWWERTGPPFWVVLHGDLVDLPPRSLSAYKRLGP